MEELILKEKFNKLVTDYNKEEDNLSAWELDMIERYYNLYILDFLEGSEEISQEKRAKIQGQDEPVLLPKDEMEKSEAMVFNFKGYKVDVLDFKHLGAVIRYCEKHSTENELRGFEKYLNKLPYAFLFGNDAAMEHAFGLKIKDEDTEITQGIMKILEAYEIIKEG